MFNKILPSGITLHDIKCIVSGLDGTASDTKTKTQYTKANITNGVNVFGGKEFIFNGTSSKITLGNIGNVLSVTMWFKIDSVNAYLIDFNGTHSISVVNSVVTLNSITGATIYINGVQENEVTIGEWYFLSVNFATAINASACVIGNIGSSFLDGSICYPIFYAKNLNENQIGQIWNNGTPYLLTRIGEGYLTFSKNFGLNQSSINADFSSGSPTGTFTVTRSATTPATYVDSSGVVTTVTNTNPRFTYGYYNSSGFVKYKGILIEGATTNLVPKSQVFNDAVWTATNVTVADNQVTSPDGTQDACSMTASAGNGTVILASAVTATTFSIWLKRKTGTGNIDITANGGTNWSTVTLSSSDWYRLQVTATSASQTCGIRIVTSADAVYAWGAQFENKTHATSYVPTTTAALTRNGETLKYNNSGNRGSAEESIYMSFMPFSTASVEAGSNNLTATDTKNRTLQLNATYDGVQFFPNSTDSSTSVASDFEIALYTAYDRFSLYASCKLNNSPSKTAQMFVNKNNGLGFKPMGGTGTTTNFTEPAWGTSFYIGSTNSNGNQPNGIYKEFKAFSRMLNQSDLGFPTKMLCVGDSITVGSSGGYRNQLEILLGRNKYDFVGAQSTVSRPYDLDHSGVGGNTVAMASTRFITEVSNEFGSGKYRSGSKVLIHIGTNGGYDATAVSLVQGMVDLIHTTAPTVAVYVALIIPRNDATNSSVVTYNGLLNTMLTTYQASKTNLYIVDFYTHWTDNPTWAADWMSDSLHPNAAGYLEMANVWYTAIQAGS